MKAIMPFLYTMAIVGLIGSGIQFAAGDALALGATKQGMAHGLLLAAILFWVIRGPVKP
jgi:hypothetical protein